jgi:hypothetical protein
MMDRVLPLPECERVHVEEFGIAFTGFEQEDVALEAVVRQVALQSQLEPRVQERPEDLVQHHLHAAIGEVAAVRKVGRVAAFGVDAVQERAERVVTDDQIAALLDRDVDVRRAPHAAIDVVDALDARGLVEERERRRCLHGFGNRDVVALVGAEGLALRRVEIAGGDVEVTATLARKAAELVRDPHPLEVAAQPALEAGVVEEARRNVVGESRHLARRRNVLDQRHRSGFEVDVARLAREGCERARDRVGKRRQRSDQIAADTRQEREEVVEQLRGPDCELTPVRVVEIDRAEHVHPAAGAFEHLHHLARRNAGGERHREDRSRREADVDVEVGDLSLDQEVVERLEPADLERAAGDGAPGEHESDLGVPLGRRSPALPNQRQTHVRTSSALRRSAVPAHRNSPMKERRSGRCADGNALHCVTLVRIDWPVDRFETVSSSQSGAQARPPCRDASRIWNGRSLW